MFYSVHIQGAVRLFHGFPGVSEPILSVLFETKYLYFLIPWADDYVSGPG